MRYNKSNNDWGEVKTKKATTLALSKEKEKRNHNWARKAYIQSS